MNRLKFTPEVGKIYENIGGGSFLCISSGKGLPNGEATMKNISSGWTFCAHGCGQYKNGEIDWDYSTDGRFVP